MSYPLSHTVVNKNKKKKRKEEKNNRNKLSRSVTNGNQYKHQTCRSTRIHFSDSELTSSYSLVLRVLPRSSNYQFHSL